MAKSAGPAWAALTGEQRLALAPLQRDWVGLDGNSKAKWLEVASRFPSMPPSERERVRQRMADWSRLTPTERGQARLQFQEARQLSPGDRQARWDEYSSLPDEARRELAKRAKPVTQAAPSPWWLKLASGFPLVVLLVGLAVIVQWNNHEQVLAAAEIDTMLLADELPPKAYADPGFAEFLKTSQP